MKRLQCRLKLLSICIFLFVFVMTVSVHASKNENLETGVMIMNQSEFANELYQFDLQELVNNITDYEYNQERGYGFITHNNDQLELAIDVPNGSYNVTVFSKSQIPLTIKAESSIRFHGTVLGEAKMIEEAFEVEVTDKQLNLMFLGSQADLVWLEVSSILKFDFGNQGTAPGYIRVPARTAYSPELGYGFNTPAKIIDRAFYNSVDPLYNDSVRFNEAGRFSDNSFNIDLAPGRYSFSFAAGAIARESLYVNGLPAILNITGQFSREQFEMEIPDGKVRITMDGKAGTSFELSALEVKKIADLKTTQPRIWLGGDSTVCNYYPLEPENKNNNAGWGQVLSFYLTNDYVVRNYATGGQTTKGFREDGAFDGIVAQIQPGEYFILQMGINDRNKYPVSEFRANLEYFVDQIREKGGIPILVTPQGRSDGFKVDPWNNLTHSVSGWAGLYDMIRIVAREKGTLLIDNANLSSAYYVSIGEAETAKLYADATHPNYAGALQLARIITEDIRKQGIPNIETTAQKTNYATDGTLTFYTPEIKDTQGFIQESLTASMEGVIVSILAKNTGVEPRVVTMITEAIDATGGVISHSKVTQQVDKLDNKVLETFLKLPINTKKLKIAIFNGDQERNEIIESTVLNFEKRGL